MGDAADDVYDSMWLYRNEEEGFDDDMNFYLINYVVPFPGIYPEKKGQYMVKAEYQHEAERMVQEQLRAEHPNVSTFYTTVVVTLGYQ